MKMMRLIVGLICVGGFIALYSCKGSDAAPTLGNWIKQPPYKGHPRAGAVVFTIGNTAYAGLGHDGTKYHSDFYAFNTDSGYWKQIATFPGWQREKAVAFSINGKGYVGTGYNRDSTTHQLNDFWEYDPNTNAWTQLNNFAGAARFNAVAFSSGNFGYVGTGYDGDFYGDFWRYNPDNDSWTEVPDYPGDKREEATVMTIKGNVYLFGGQNNSGSLIADMWQFDNEKQTWSNVSPLTTDAQYANFKAAVGRYDAVAFSINDKGYITTGSNGAFLNTTYQFDPADLSWTKMTNYERAIRSQAFAFVLNNRAFLATGSNAGFHFDNMDEFLPLLEYDAND